MGHDDPCLPAPVGDETTRPDPLAPPVLARFADLEVEVGVPIEVGQVAGGLRRLIPITGGRCEGRGFTARVLPGGADFQLVTSATVARLEARYVLETDAGDRIYVRNDAVRTAPAAVMARLVRGEPVDPGDVYFRCVPRFETGASALAWIAERVFVGVGVRRPSTVVMRFFEVL
ncbi:MAG: DUF3237 domain-containing protein [Caldimonas sp.]